MSKGFLEQQKIKAKEAYCNDLSSTPIIINKIVAQTIRDTAEEIISIAMPKVAIDGSNLHKYVLEKIYAKCNELIGEQ